MAVTLQCACGAEYVVGEAHRAPPQCRFCGEGHLSLVSARPSSTIASVLAPPCSWQKQGPLARDRFAIEALGGGRAIFWGAVLGLAFLLPRQVSGEALFGWQVFSAPDAGLGLRLLTGLSLGAAALAVLLGLAASALVRGLVLLCASLTAFVVGAVHGVGISDSGRHLALLFGFGLLLGAVGASVKLPRSRVGRIGNLLGGFLFLAILGLQYRTHGNDVLSDVPIGWYREAVIATAVAALLAVISAGTDRGCQCLGRIASWLCAGACTILVISSFSAPGAGDAFYHLERVLLWTGFLCLGITGTANTLFAIAGRAQAQAEDQARREDVGFLQRYRADAVFGSERARQGR